MQYGQRKLHRSMTEMRRSRTGRESGSRGAGSAFSGTMTSRLDMGFQSMRTAGGKGYRSKGSRPAIDPRHEPLGVGVGARRQLDKTTRPGERREVPGAVGGSGHGPGPPPVVLLEAHRQEVRERWRNRHGRSERDALRRRRILTEAAAQRRQHVAYQAHQRRDRVAGQAKHG